MTDGQNSKGGKEVRKRSKDGLRPLNMSFLIINHESSPVMSDETKRTEMQRDNATDETDTGNRQQATTITHISQITATLKSLATTEINTRTKRL